MGWGLHTLVLGTLHCQCLLGLGQESAHQTQSSQSSCSTADMGAGPLLPWVTFGNVFCSVMGSSCTAHPFTSYMAECGSS